MLGMLSTLKVLKIFPFFNLIDNSSSQSNQPDNGSPPITLKKCISQSDILSVYILFNRFRPTFIWAFSPPAYDGSSAYTLHFALSAISSTAILGCSLVALPRTPKLTQIAFAFLHPSCISYMFFASCHPHCWQLLLPHTPSQTVSFSKSRLWQHVNFSCCTLQSKYNSITNVFHSRFFRIIAVQIVNRSDLLSPNLVQNTALFRLIHENSICMQWRTLLLYYYPLVSMLFIHRPFENESYCSNI